MTGSFMAHPNAKMSDGHRSVTFIFVASAELTCLAFASDNPVVSWHAPPRAAISQGSTEKHYRKIKSNVFINDMMPRSAALGRMGPFYFVADSGGVG
ncbi:MAG: hypothetical protein R3C05_05550 [Pirellulaceae bacterium]